MRWLFLYDSSQDTDRDLVIAMIMIVLGMIAWEVAPDRMVN